MTPIAPAEAFVRFGEVTEPYFRKQEEGAPRVPRGRWHRQFVADKPQNISSATGKQRTRYLASMPRVLDKWSAELHRYTQGGRFPRWDDDSVNEEIERYANLLDRSTEYINADIRGGLDRRAEQLIDAAREFIDETVTEVSKEYPEATLPAPPPVIAVLLSRRWPTGGFDRARRVLTDDHFKSRLDAKGER